MTHVVVNEFSLQPFQLCLFIRDSSLVSFSCQPGELSLQIESITRGSYVVILISSGLLNKYLDWAM